MPLTPDLFVTAVNYVISELRIMAVILRYFIEFG